MKRKGKLSYIVNTLLAVVLSLSLAGCDRTNATKRSADIAVLYTGDVHCAVDENIGYAGLALGCNPADSGWSIYNFNE